MADYVAGFVYGLASTMVGQPFDTIKTRMQAMEQIKSKGVYETGKEIFIKEGIRGLYRGGLPMILGGGALRSAQFGVNNSVLELIKRNNLVDSDYKHFGFLRLNVVLAGFCGGLARGFVETPIEFMKVRRQVEKKWEWREVTGGSGKMFIASLHIHIFTCILIHIYIHIRLSLIGVTLFRNSILFTSFVIYVDLSKQVFPNGLCTITISFINT